MIAAVLALTGLLRPQLAYEPGDVFLFPRTLKQPFVGEVRTTLDGENFGVAITALRDALLEGINLSSQGQDSATRKRQSDFVEDLFSRANGLIENRIISPTQPLDLNLTGFWQSRYRFSLSGAVLGLRSEVFASIRTEAIYRSYRGYWVDLGFARIFYGAGTQLRFKITGGRKPFHREQYSSYSPQFPATLGEATGLAVEQYGNTEPILRQQVIKDGKYLNALQRTLQVLDHVQVSEFGGDIEGVEPILIQLSAPIAQIYVSESLKRSQARRSQSRTPRPFRTGVRR